MEQGEEQNDVPILGCPRNCVRLASTLFVPLGNWEGRVLAMIREPGNLPLPALPYR